MEIILRHSNLKNLTEPLHRIYVLWGDDSRLMADAVETLKEAALDPDFADFDFDVKDADTAPLEWIAAGVAATPVGAGRRVVLVRSAEVLRRRERERDAEKLALLLPKVPGSAVLIFTVFVPSDAAGKIILTRTLDKVVRQEGMLARCSAPTGDEMGQWLAEHADLMGKQLEPMAGEMLAARTQGNTALLDQELRKLVAYAGARNVITIEDVAAVVSDDGEDVMFQLVDALGTRNTHKALALLAELLRYDPRPQAVAGRLIVLLVRQLRLIWQAKELAQMGYGPGALRSLPASVTDLLPSDGSITSIPWKAQDLFRAARLWQTSELVRAFNLLAECDLANKGGEDGNADIVLNLQVLVMKLCLGSRKFGEALHQA